MKLLLLSASFALTAYAGVRLLEDDWLAVALWLVGAAVLHDLVLLPLYSAADRAVGVVGPRVHNYVRFPAAVSALLLLVFFPLILRVSPGYESASLHSMDVYLGRWLWITGVLFGVSAVVYGVRAAWHRGVR